MFLLCVFCHVFFFVFFLCVCTSVLSVGVVVNVVVCMFTSSFLLEYQQHWQLSLNSATVHVFMYMYMYYTYIQYLHRSCSNVNTRTNIQVYTYTVCTSHMYVSSSYVLRTCIVVLIQYRCNFIEPKGRGTGCVQLGYLHWVQLDIRVRVHLGGHQLEVDIQDSIHARPAGGSGTSPHCTGAKETAAFREYCYCGGMRVHSSAGNQLEFSNLIMD